MSSLISVILVTVRLRLMTYNVFCTAVPGRIIVKLIRTYFSDTFHIVFRIRFSHIPSVEWKISPEFSRVVPGELHVSAFLWLDSTIASRGLGWFRTSWSLSEIGFPKQDFHVMAYKSSCLKMTSRSSFHTYHAIWR